MFFRTKNGTLHLFQEAQKNPKNQGPVRQHGLNLVKGICTGSQVRSWLFLRGKPTWVPFGGETYLRISNLLVPLGPGNKKDIKKTPSPQKNGGNLHDWWLVFSPHTHHGCWCVCVCVCVFLFVGRLTWELTQVVHPKKKRTIRYLLQTLRPPPNPTNFDRAHLKI